MPAKGTYPRQWTKQLRQSIRVRQNYCCAVCGEKAKKDLNIHHIDENKGNCQKGNLVALCVKCHGVVHGKGDADFYREQLTIYARYRDAQMETLSINRQNTRPSLVHLLESRSD